MIDNTLIEKNKKKLHAEKERLEKLLSRVSNNGTAKYPDLGSAEEDNAAEVAAYETNIAEEFDLKKKYKLVTAALARIDSGTYGICQIGGEEISAARLEAAPEAANCVKHEK